MHRACGKQQNRETDKEEYKLTACTVVGGIKPDSKNTDTAVVGVVGQSNLYLSLYQQHLTPICLSCTVQPWHASKCWIAPSTPKHSKKGVWMECGRPVYKVAHGLLQKHALSDNNNLGLLCKPHID